MTSGVYWQNRINDDDDNVYIICQFRHARKLANYVTLSSR